MPGLSPGCSHACFHLVRVGWHVLRLHRPDWLRGEVFAISIPDFASAGKVQNNIAANTEGSKTLLPPQRHQLLSCSHQLDKVNKAAPPCPLHCIINLPFHFNCSQAALFGDNLALLLLHGGEVGCGMLGVTSL